MKVQCSSPKFVVLYFKKITPKCVIELSHIKDSEEKQNKTELCADRACACNLNPAFLLFIVTVLYKNGHSKGLIPGLYVYINDQRFHYLPKIESCILEKALNNKC